MQVTHIPKVDKIKHFSPVCALFTLDEMVAWRKGEHWPFMSVSETTLRRSSGEMLAVLSLFVYHVLLNVRETGLFLHQMKLNTLFISLIH